MAAKHFNIQEQMFLVDYLTDRIFCDFYTFTFTTLQIHLLIPNELQIYISNDSILEHSLDYLNKNVRLM